MATTATKRASAEAKTPSKRASKPAPSPETNGDDIFYLNVRIATALRERMEGYCETYGVGRRYVVTRALEDFLNSRDTNPPQ